MQENIFVHVRGPSPHMMQTRNMGRLLSGWELVPNGDLGIYRSRNIQYPSPYTTAQRKKLGTDLFLLDLYRHTLEVEWFEI